MPKFVIECGEEDYRIIGPGSEEGELAEYGETASLVIEDGDHQGQYTALLTEEPDDGRDPEPPEGIVFRGQAMETVIEHVDFEDTEEEGEEGEDEEESGPKESGSGGMA